MEPSHNEQEKYYDLELERGAVFNARRYVEDAIEFANTLGLQGKEITAIVTLKQPNNPYRFHYATKQ